MWAQLRLNAGDAFDFVDDGRGKAVGLLACWGFGIDADDWLGVGFAQMHPALWEIYLDSVDIGYFELFVTAFYDTQYAIDVDLWGEFYLVFRDIIVWIYP